MTAAGTFDATNTVCTYSDGTTVTFDQPLTIPIPVDTPPEWSFTIARGGTTCVRYERTAIKRTFTVMEQTYSDMAVGEAGIQVSCPDGTIYKTDDESTVTACPGASTLVPREAFFSDTTSVSMELYGAGPDGTRRAIFNCRRP